MKNLPVFLARATFWLGCLASFVLPQTSWALEPLSPSGWQKLARSASTPTAVVFTASYCPTCPLAIKALADHRAAANKSFKIATVALDHRDVGEEGNAGSSRSLYGGVDLAMFPVPSAVALRYAVSPTWRGETPMVAMLRPGAKPRLVLGMPKAQDLRWLSGED